MKKFMILPTSPAVAVCTDFAGADVRERHICSVRHPNVVFIPCFAHLASLQCGYLITLRPHAHVVSDCLHIARFFTKSKSKWTPRLQDAMKQVYSSSFSSVTAVFTRWTSTWILLVLFEQKKLYS